MPDPKKKYASLSSDAVRELVLGLAGTMPLRDARDKLQRLAQRFPVQDVSTDGLTLWVYGYQLTDADRQQGLLGRFVQLAIVPEAVEGMCRIAATVLDKPLHEHPRTNKPRQLPNSGHPTFRAMARNRVFPSKQDAIRVLDNLQHDFPGTSIRRSEEQMRSLFYRRDSAGQANVQSWLLFIDECPGGFRICGEIHRPTRAVSQHDQTISALRVDEAYPSTAALLDFILGEQELA